MLKNHVMMEVSKSTGEYFEDQSAYPCRASPLHLPIETKPKPHFLCDRCLLIFLSTSNNTSLLLIIINPTATLHRAGYGIHREQHLRRTADWRYAYDVEHQGSWSGQLTTSSANFTHQRFTSSPTPTWPTWTPTTPTSAPTRVRYPDTHSSGRCKTCRHMPHAMPRRAGVAPSALSAPRRERDATLVDAASANRCQQMSAITHHATVHVRQAKIVTEMETSAFATSLPTAEPIGEHLANRRARNT